METGSEDRQWGKMKTMDKMKKLRGALTNLYQKSKNHMLVFCFFVSLHKKSVELLDI